MILAGTGWSISLSLLGVFDTSLIRFEKKIVPRALALRKLSSKRNCGRVHGVDDDDLLEQDSFFLHIQN